MEHYFDSWFICFDFERFIFSISLFSDTFSTCFLGLDAYYLRQERLFRELYDSVRRTKRKDIDPYSFSTQSVNGKVKNWFCTLFSPTVILLHGAVILFITIFI